MKSIVYLITSNGMGSSTEQPLKNKLITTFLNLTMEQQLLPAAICFYTDGVKLACEDSPVLEQLRKLESMGVRLILCQTCIKYYDLEEKVKAGIVGGMADIITCMTQADSVITV
jgi:intracellular sulfur oxidation DsrE/DsrF family protein